MNNLKNKLKFIKNIDTTDFNVKFLSVVAYIGPLFLMGKFSVEKENEFLKFHINQAVRLFVFELLSSVIFSLIIDLSKEILSMTVIIIVYAMGIIIALSWICMIYIGISNVIHSEITTLPIIGGK